MLLNYRLLVVACFVACNNVSPGDKLKVPATHVAQSNTENPYKTVSEIPLPTGYTSKINKGSFAEWLNNIELKKDKTVYKYDGTVKQNQHAQFAVLNISVGNKNLQQCADAVMRLRAEYLYHANRFAEISFIDNNIVYYNFHPPYTRNNFTAYLEKVFGMCGSASLAKQLKLQINIKHVEAGDVLIRGGFPGHAVIVLKVAANEKGEKIYLLAQSYMPAQNIHILKNPSDKLLSPWYKVSEEKNIETPEYTFTKYELKRW